jgi:hypothetical protein
MRKAKGDFHFLQEGRDGLGIHVNIPTGEQDSIQYSINFLKSLI